MSGGIDPGRISLRLTCRDGRVTEAAVASERPRAAVAFRGRAADDVPRLVPLLFALCGRAQGRAAELAVAAARGSSVPPHVDDAVTREALREHLWRWLLDLPPLLGLAPMREEFPRAARAIADGRWDELRTLLADRHLIEMQARLIDMEDVEGNTAQLLPLLDAAGSIAAWPCLTAGFCQMPSWHGAAAETGALARRGDAGNLGGAIAAHWLSRLAELRQGADGSLCDSRVGRISSASPAAGSGRALVETARGLLMHEVDIDGDGRVADYRIVAPTEWNFHPDGPLRGWLLGRPADGSLRGILERAVLALDPCVRWEVEIRG